MNANLSQQQLAELYPSLETVIVTKTREIADGFSVRRALPSVRRRMVGPFVFLDQMGPEILGAGKALDVAAHPHIGLATVTYLFAGEILHRDSLGTEQIIEPGAVNWMTAGSGIAHSERTPTEIRNTNSEIFGAQVWVALPKAAEETAPSFAHYEAAELPVIEAEGKQVRVIAGSLYGAKSPVKTFSEMFYADVALEKGARLPVPTEHEERAIYVVAGEIEILPDAGKFSAGQLLVLKPKETITVVAHASQARFMLLGGAPMDGERHIWWNFVSSSRERIEQAKEDWRGGRFGKVIGETDFIPLPESKPPVVRYP